MAIKVLVVDDAPFIREVMRQILSAEGFEIVGEALDGEDAIEKARLTQPDVILMDLVMPNLSGIEATKEILKENPNQKIIACTTLDQDLMVMRALDAGCIHYISKPFKKNDLLSAIRISMEKENKSENSL